MTSGFASLHHPRDWSLSHVRSPSLRLALFRPITPSTLTTFGRRKFESITEGLADALDFSRTIGAESGREGLYERGGGPGVLGQVDFFTRSVHLAQSHHPG